MMQPCISHGNAKGFARAPEASCIRKSTEYIDCLLQISPWLVLGALIVDE